MSTNTQNESRENKGRFAPGNPGGPGNPFARQVAALRQALLNSVTADDIQAVAKALIQRASEGNVQAAKLLLSYSIGKPQPAPEPDHMDADEWDVYRETVPMKQESGVVVGAGVPEAHLKVARMMRPLVAQMMGQEMAAMFMETPEQREAKEAAAAADAERMMNSPGPELSAELESALNGEASPNGSNGSPPPLPNGYYGEARPSPNGHFGTPPSPNSDRMRHPGCAPSCCFLPSPPVLRGRGAGGEGDGPRGNTLPNRGMLSPLTPALSP